ncbi:hypothetical protein CYPRO_1732 [Cyclonatronum proteinivorum]|uniref:Uncharacterized protein n=1 Tax=Cyclonatronum proteinivorum TaxID=1457365 RepID=A0A345UKI0_9BACT|nr:hypothetical protein CYPRO_1732 [Cyclonatronum proteinivorum]
MMLVSNVLTPVCDTVLLTDATVSFDLIHKLSFWLSFLLARYAFCVTWFQVCLPETGLPDRHSRAFFVGS